MPLKWEKSVIDEPFDVLINFQNRTRFRELKRFAAKKSHKICVYKQLSIVSITIHRRIGMVPTAPRYSGD